MYLLLRGWASHVLFLIEYAKDTHDGFIRCGVYSNCGQEETVVHAGL